MKHLAFSSPILNSRIRTEETRKREQWLGYFLGPCRVHMMYTGIAGTYLIAFFHFLWQAVPAQKAITVSAMAKKPLSDRILVIPHHLPCETVW